MEGGKKSRKETIPAIVRDVEDLTSLEHALVENLHRQDLGPLEEAAAYQQLIDDFQLSQEAVAKASGRVDQPLLTHYDFFNYHHQFRVSLWMGD